MPGPSGTVGVKTASVRPCAGVVSFGMVMTDLGAMVMAVCFHGATRRLGMGKTTISNADRLFLNTGSIGEERIDPRPTKFNFIAFWAISTSILVGALCSSRSTCTCSGPGTATCWLA
jgi:hypothetical protein